MTRRSRRGTRPLRRGRTGTPADWAELLRVSAAFTIPGDAVAGAAATGRRPGGGTWLAAGTSLCLYHAGMALNDYADRHEDAADRPHRPIPSGRISPAVALTAAGALTATGLALAARAGRPALAVAGALAATVWAYDLHLKHTAAGPAAMAAARGLDLLLGAAATHPAGARRALPSAAMLGAHTYAVTTVSRQETHQGTAAAPTFALATGCALASLTGITAPGAGPREQAAAASSPLAAAAYLHTMAAPTLHAALHPTPSLTQRAVGAGIRAMIPLQAALTARSGAPGTALALLGLAPAARRLARKVSPT